jgi:hypothetical protein
MHNKVGGPRDNVDPLWLERLTSPLAWDFYPISLLEHSIKAIWAAGAHLDRNRRRDGLLTGGIETLKGKPADCDGVPSIRLFGHL